MKVFRLYLCAALFVCLGGWASAQTPATPPATYAVVLDIAPQPIEKALNTLAQQAGLQLLFRSDALMEGVIAPRLSGSFTAREALDKLLEGTHLAYKFIDDQTVAIRAARPTAAVGETGSDARVAQAQERRPPAQTATGESDEDGPPEAPSVQAVAPLQEVLVTGTHIRGVASVGSPLIVIDREQIRQTGYANVPDVLKTLPQLFSGTAQTIDGTGTLGNFGRGFSVDLRGLGAGTTLILIDGRRQTSSGLLGNFVDVSTIPISAIERIEVMTDGATATYGSDAIGGVVNIILRKDFKGAETRARYGSYNGDADEVQISQLLGTAWTRGNATVGFQYQKRTTLYATDRSYSANSNQQARGGSDWRTSYNNPGNIEDPFTGLPLYAIPRGQNGAGVTSDDLIPFTSSNLHDTAQGTELVGRDELKSVYGDLSQHLNDRIELFASARYSERPWRSEGKAGLGQSFFVTPDNPNFVDLPAPNGGLGYIIVDYNFRDDFRPTTLADTHAFEGTVGSRIQMGAGWRGQISGSLAEEKLDFRTRIINGQLLDEALGNNAFFGSTVDNPDTPYNPFVDGFFNPFGDGSDNSPAVIDAITRFNRESPSSRTWNATAQADGPLMDLPNGPLRLAVGADFRSERLESGANEIRADRLSRHLTAVHLELAAPVTRHLSVFGAVRYEDYSDFGHAITPKLGASWNVIPSITLRGTWGQSYKAPALSQKDTSAFNRPQIQLIPFLTDPTSPTGFTSGLFLVGVDPSLHEETADIWTAGMDFRPASIPGLIASLTYHSIDYTDRITVPGAGSGESQLQLLLDEDAWARFITRNPSQERVDALCHDPTFFAPPSFCAAFPPTVILDGRLTNLASLKETGLDTAFDYAFGTHVGNFRARLAATYAFKNSRRAADAAPSVDIIDTVGNPLAFKGRATLQWEAHGWTVNGALNYAKRYEDRGGRVTPQFALTSATDVGSWTTADLGVAYLFTQGNAALEGLEVRGNVINIFNRAPPFVDNPYGFDFGNADPYGRLISVELVKSW